MARDKGVSGFRTAALMIGLGTFMMLLSVKHLPDVWRAYARLETGCQIIESSIRDNQEKGTFDIYLDLRWRVDGSEYGTSKPEPWREKRQKHSSLDYLLSTYVKGELVSCFYDEEHPSRVYPEKAKGTELGWLVIMGLAALALMGLGSLRVVRRVRRPKRHRVTIREGVSFDYVPTVGREGPAVTPAINVWQPVFESLGFERPDKEAFRYSSSEDGVSVNVFLAELDGQTAVLGFKRPPLTVRFDHPDGKREVYFWHGTGPEMILCPKSVNFGFYLMRRLSRVSRSPDTTPRPLQPCSTKKADGFSASWSWRGR